MSNRALVLTGAAFVALSLGCASRSSRPVYSPSSVGTPVAIPSHEQHGRIVAVRDVTIKDGSTVYSSSGPGGAAGAVVSTARVLTGGVYGIIGVVGDALEKAKPEYPAEELQIITDDGKSLIIVQELSTPPFAPEERVIIQRNPAATGSRPASAVRVIREQFVSSEAVADARRVGAPRSRFDTR